MAVRDRHCQDCAASDSDFDAVTCTKVLCIASRDDLAQCGFASFVDLKCRNGARIGNANEDKNPD
jgi:hypothetical protein